MTSSADTSVRRALPNGVGLGLRWEFLEEVLDGPALDVAFFEVSPENYMRRGGYYPAALERIGQRYPLVTHGLTLSIGAHAPPDPDYLSELRDEVERLDPPWHSDHLAFTSAGAHALHELFPLRFSNETARRVADRLEALALALGRPVAVENITYYAVPGPAELSEGDFWERSSSARARASARREQRVRERQEPRLRRAASARELPVRARRRSARRGPHAERLGPRARYARARPSRNPVLELLGWTLERTGPVPVLLERDNDVPPLPTLLAEVRALAGVCERAWAKAAHGEESRASGA